MWLLTGRVIRQLEAIMIPFMGHASPKYVQKYGKHLLSLQTKSGSIFLFLFQKETRNKIKNMD